MRLINGICEEYRVKPKTSNCLKERDIKIKSKILQIKK